VTQEVKGYCPMGCGQTLFVGACGHITCRYVGCPRPSAVVDLLAPNEPHHLVVFDDTGFTIKHPLRERLDDGLLTCDLHQVCADLPGPPPQRGTYRVRGNETGKWDVWFPVGEGST
jgi:hypothetical protein